MNTWKLKLIGELVGLARATDGNEHLISPQSTAVVRECLASAPDCDAEYHKLLHKVEDAKRAMVPDCFLCANPCGKTASFDLRELDTAPEDIRAAKGRILDALVGFSLSAPENSLYRGLIVLGMDGLNPEFLDTIALELHP